MIAQAGQEVTARVGSALTAHPSPRTHCGAMGVLLGQVDGGRVQLPPIMFPGQQLHLPLLAAPAAVGAPAAAAAAAAAAAVCCCCYCGGGGPAVGRGDRVVHECVARAGGGAAAEDERQHRHGGHQLFQQLADKSNASTLFYTRHLRTLPKGLLS